MEPARDSRISARPATAFLLDPVRGERIYGPEERAALAAQVELCTGFIGATEWRRHTAALAEVEIVMSGWGAPSFDETLLAAMPRLRAMFYGSGSVKKVVSEAFWRRGIVLTCAAELNAVPVAEYAASQIFWLLKDGYRYAQAMRGARGRVEHWIVPGGYRSRVGLVSLSRIGRLVAQRLRSSDLEVVAYDPFATPDEAACFGARLVGLDELFCTSHIVSLHAPLLPETQGLIGAEILSKLRPGAAFLNTARGALVDQEALTRILAQRPDVFAVLDVTWPEPPPPDSLLYDLPNVVLTPHIAGSLYDECRRMGRAMVAEVRRFIAGEPLRWALTAEQVSLSA